MLAYSTVILAFLQFCFTDGLDDLTVTLAVFSGSPDPVWQVPSTDVNYRTIKGMLDGAEKYYPRQMPARLGFKGFLVQEGKKDQYLIVGPETQQLQMKLLETMPRDLSGESSLLEGNLQQIREEMKFVKADVLPAAASTLRAKRYAPWYLPNQWFIDPHIRRCNNCYNYANDKRTNTFSQPGLANGQAFQLNNPQTVQTAAQADGLVALNPQPAANQAVPGAPAGPRHLVALVVDPGVPNVRTGDFHWYRLDGQFNNGRWSHKPGEVLPTNRDNAGHYITDPRQAAMGHYQFVSFMTTNRNTVNIQNNNLCV